MNSLSASSLIGYAIDFEHFLEWILTCKNSGINHIKGVSLTLFQNINPTQIKKDYVYYLNSKEYKVSRRLNGKQLTQKTLTRKMAAIIPLYPWLSEIAKNCKGEPLLKEIIMVNILYKQQRL
ncbi:hypothetical protein [Bacillus thuringiensis]|uniref:hypothetical protein n=1 Tax=Bacillus thuringiensis TaxID=1428 RepID=UPI00119CC64B|nr:hypothetical protein [Bacillus thuringiensis]